MTWKMKMNNLRKYVRTILLEARRTRKKKPKIIPAPPGARNIGDFTKNTYIVIKKIKKKEYKIYYAHIDEDGDLAETKSYHSDLFPGYDQATGSRGTKTFNPGKRPFPMGYITIEKKTSDEGTKLGKCANAWSIQMVRTAKGWGPLLYDIAMEFLTKNFGGLMADRLTVSDSASPVWDFYQNKRKDPSIKSYQMDDLAGTLKKLSKTKDPTYKQYKSLKAGDKCYQASLGPNWVQNPRSKRWTKQPIILNELERLELIFYI